VRLAGAGVVAAVVLVAGCTGTTQAPTPTATPVATTPGPSSEPSTTPTPSPPAATTSISSATPTTSAAPWPAADPVVRAVGDAEWAQMVSTGTWRAGCPVSRTHLRRVEVAYAGFDGRPHRGALVVNADVAASVARVFARLYDERFPIRRMVPVEAYGGDDDASMRADNTSAFNCRRPGQANAPAPASPHANGRAVDLNPYENPWVDPRCGCFQPDSRYGRQRSGPGVVVRGGVPWRAFTREGWVWQDSRTIDYQHFDTGYPSRPLP
jgi:hypothetical protein